MPHTFDPQNESQPIINFKNKWLAAHQEVMATQSLEQIVDSIKILENNSIFSNELVVVYKTQDFTPLYISKNVEKVMGFTQQEYMSWKDGAFFKRGVPNQIDYFDNLLKWKEHFNQRTPHKKPKTLGRLHSCGKSYLHKNGSEIRFLLRQELVLGEDLKLPAIGVLYYKEITHLLKGEDYWILCETFDPTGSSFSKFYRKDGIDNYPITPREKEIILLISEGKSTKEVALALNISPETVGQHRKNMIRKMMAKDTSSLIQLCKTCSII